MGKTESRHEENLEMFPLFCRGGVEIFLRFRRGGWPSRGRYGLVGVGMDRYQNLFFPAFVTNLKIGLLSMGKRYRWEKEDIMNERFWVLLYTVTTLS